MPDRQRRFSFCAAHRPGFGTDRGVGFSREPEKQEKAEGIFPSLTQQPTGLLLLNPAAPALAAFRARFKSRFASGRKKGHPYGCPFLAKECYFNKSTHIVKFRKRDNEKRLRANEVRRRLPS